MSIHETTSPASPESPVGQIATAAGGSAQIHQLQNESGELVHSFATMSFPLRKDHWIYQKDETATRLKANVPPMPFRMGEKHTAHIIVLQPTNEEIDDARQFPLNRRLTREEFAHAITAAGRYAVRCATMNGAETDFDPDALVGNLVVGMLGYWTEDGLTGDPEDAGWCDPQKPFDFTPPPPRNFPNNGAAVASEPTGTNPTPES